MAEVRPIPSETVREAVGRALGGGHFFVEPTWRLRVEHVASEQAVFELFRGHLLDASHSRRREEFETWNVFLDEASTPAEAPLLSLRWQRASGQLYVVRRILTYGFEAYEEAPGVILSREAQKWVAELVGTIALNAIGRERLEAELSQYVFLAVIGTSRLSITSLESPLPAFSLGQLAYLPGLAATDRVWEDAEEFLQAALASNGSTVELAKALELALRATPAKSVAGIARILREAGAPHTAERSWRGDLFRALFNSAVLSPYTGYVDALVAVLMHLALDDEAGAAEVVDTISYMLRHLCRHLTAFDLSVFHNFGANYPDALFLDALLAAYLQQIKLHPGHFVAPAEDSSTASEVARRRRRRALRQACLVRSSYEGHRVPDAPTSMGENARVLPPEYSRVPEDQILQAARRSRRLFEGRPLVKLLDETGRRVLAQSCEDLRHPPELRELGMALFLDRPLGIFKEPGEVDRTPLVSYEAFSRQIAAKRLARAVAGGWIDAESYAQSLEALNELLLEGRPLSEIAAQERPGVVSLADAAKGAPDFSILRTTRGSLDAFLSHFNLNELESSAPDCAGWLLNDRHVLLTAHTPANRPSSDWTLRCYDRQGALRLEMGFEAVAGHGVRYRERGGVELVEQLRVLAADSPVWLRLK